MKKIAILTITDGQNYGNRLQNYALQKVLTGLGFDVETIKRKTWRDLRGIKKYKQLIKKMIKVVLGYPCGRYHKLRVRSFEKFNNRYLKFSDVVLSDNRYPSGLSERYDYFVVGSDQVWNAGFRIIYEDIKNHLAFFAESQQRISYAASFGTDKIAPGYEDVFKEELPKFKAVSVREISGVRIARECGVEATVVIDPTMLLTGSQWLEIAKKPSYIEDEPFILTYFLGDRDDELNDYIRRISEGKKIVNLEIESVLDDKISSVDEYCSAPDEFVWLAANADCIITDSFHATVFSILFHRPFCVFERKAINDSYKMGSRLDTLLELFHLDRFHDSNRSFSVIPEEYVTDEIEQILMTERKKSMEFLRSALSE